MNNGRCQQRKKEMMGTTFPISRVPSNIPANMPASVPARGVDLFSQARKALTERSPFDVWDPYATPSDASAPSSVSLTAFNVRNLPRGLVGLLSSRSSSDSRKRHKKSHSSGNKYTNKKKKSSSRKERGMNVWIETEEYFRELYLTDVEHLYEASTLQYLAASKCFFIPLLNDGNNSNTITDNVKEFSGSMDGLVVNDGEKGETLEIDTVEQKTLSGLEGTGLEWMLGLKNRVLLTSERPNKKRKLLGEDAGLEKLIVGQPCKENSSLCHVCSMGEDDERFRDGSIVCSSCNVHVHRKCYGVQDNEVVGSWVCSWCKHKNDLNSDVTIEHPCVLCPKQDGALKPVQDADDGNTKFAHLFCSLWMPEVYVEDTKTMEPIMNVDGIKETRKKLICNICKIKCGACIRCSNGACRTSFHPLCAREASHRTEIWGKLGIDNVEMRAFCSKHSDTKTSCGSCQVGDLSGIVADHQVPSATSHDLKIGHRNGDSCVVESGVGANSDELGDTMVHDKGFSDIDNVLSQCIDMKESTCLEALEKANFEDLKPSFVVILKRLIERGKVNAKEIAVETGTSPGALATALANDDLAPELQSKIILWLKNHAYIGGVPKNLKLRMKSAISSIENIGAADSSDTESETDAPNCVPVKSVPPRRRTQSSIRILKNDKVTSSPKEMSTGNGDVVNDVEMNQHGASSDGPIEEAMSDLKEKILADLTPSNACSKKPCLGFETDAAKPQNQSIPEAGAGKDEDIYAHVSLVNSESIANDIVAHVHNMILNRFVKYMSCYLKTEMHHILTKKRVPWLDIASTCRNCEDASGSYVHPYIRRNLVQLHSGEVLKVAACKRETEISSSKASSSINACYNHQNHYSSCNGMGHKNGLHLQQLIKAGSGGIINLSPEDEVEGELIYFQQRLIHSAVTRKHYSDDLILKAVKNLSQEVDSVRSRRWDSVLLNKYLSELREAKKQGRKERRHKEAQAVLAAATAAAAASSRISSLRKDAFEDAAQQENVLTETSAQRVGGQSQLMLRAKETLPRVALSRVSFEKNSDILQSASELHKELLRSCDICRRSETLLNSILVCSTCKVAVHLDCYRSIKDSAGPWKCELCEDLSSRSTRSPIINSWEKPIFVAECGICGGTTGALRKSTDGQWVHAFCAEWVFESTFRRGQINLIEGMGMVRMNFDICCVCHHRKGVCIKCNYGHCQSTFHPSCARSAGFYMILRTGAGKPQHKAYCEKHSMAQRAKVENQKHGMDELKNLKHIRVELERLRLLCERIVRREKLKRDLVMCSHEILAAKRDSVAFSALVRRPYFPPDVSSESATTSLHHSFEGMQKSDDVTVDSTSSVKHHFKLRLSADKDLRTDGSSASQHAFPLKSTERLTFSGKKIPHISLSAAQNNLDDREMSSKLRKPPETFEKELIMTSDQATMKNQRLPKGFVYVPVGCLQDDNKQSNQDACSRESLDGDG